MNGIKRLFLSVLLCAGVAAPAAADFESGLAAYYKLDYATALQEWLPLAEQGDAKSVYQLGVLYYRGEGVLRNDRTAAKWFETAAELGDPDAQYNLAVMYANGEGIVQNLERAHMWFLIADWRYQTGDGSEWALKSKELAARNRDLTAAQISEASVARARRQAEQKQALLLALDRQATRQAPPMPVTKEPIAAAAPAAGDCQAAECDVPAMEQPAFAAAPTAKALPESARGSEEPDLDIFPIVSDYRSPTGPTGNNRSGPHWGIDIRAPKGTPVLAVADGTVYRSRLHNENGHEIKIKHAMGTADEIRIHYGNLDQNLVKVGDKVKRGQVIGIVGNSGSESRTEMTFLHFALWTSSKRGAGGTCCNSKNPNDFWYDTGEVLPIFRPDGDYSDQPHRFVYPVPAKSDLDFFKGMTTALNWQ